MKRLLALPIVWLILGAVAIATEIKTTDPLPAAQQFSGAVVTCVKAALAKRETAVITVVTLFQSGNLSALTIKKTALLTAWATTTKSAFKSANFAASKAYKASMKDLKKVQNTAKKSIWSTYKTEVKACKGNNGIAHVDNGSRTRKD